MQPRETLETALLSSWDRDTLAVYADHLLAEGDPRGELIALDLQIAATGNTAELAKRRTSLVFAWLGALVPTDDVHASWIGDSLRFGFVDHLFFSGARGHAVARLEQALASPAGPYVRALSMVGTVQELEAALTALAQHEHRWLTQLTITGFHDARVAPDVLAAAFRAMPNLATLALRSPATVFDLSHLTIKHLELQGRETYEALGDGATFAAVEALDLDLANAYEEEWDDEPGAPREAALPRVRFPALRRLAIDGAFADALAFVRTFDARTRLTSLRIPHLRSASERNDLLGALVHMPALATVEVAHGSYYAPPEIPGIRLVGAEVWPWPPQEAVHAAALRVFMPNAKYGDEVALLDAVQTMELLYERQPPEVRTAWATLWRAIPAQGTGELSASVLADALEAIPSLMTNGWRELREALSSRRPLAADATVRIERCFLE